MKNAISCERKKVLVKLCFSLHFILLDPDPNPRTQMNPDPTGSGSTLLTGSVSTFLTKKLFPFFYKRLENNVTNHYLKILVVSVICNIINYYEADIN